MRAQEDPMLNKPWTLSPFIALALAALVQTAHASDVKVTITVDNAYALYYGTHDHATNFIGRDGDWRTAETYNFKLSSSQYLYVVTASDLSAAQGFLGQFENLSSGYKFYSHDPQWQVTATGLGPGAPYSGSVADFSLLAQEIQDANAGGNPSNGWVPLTTGPVNGSSPWSGIGGIDQAAHWSWYSSNGDPDPTTPGFDHKEWLIFRIAVAATPDNPIPNVPEPAAVLMLLAGAMAVATVKRGSRSQG
jgi:hypothetical protein